MIKACHHWFYKYFFDVYTHRKMKANFHKVEIAGQWSKSNKATLLIGNHISWWDGFWTLYLNKHFIGKRFHVMMLEEQLSKRKPLSKVGAYSINPGSRSVIDSINYTAQLLENGQNCVVLYPQGKINSMYQCQIGFEKGIEKILAKSPSVQVLFYVALVDYFSEPKPLLTFYLKEIDYQKYTSEALNVLFQQFYDECIQIQCNKKQ